MFFPAPASQQAAAAFASNYATRIPNIIRKDSRSETSSISSKGRYVTHVTAACENCRKLKIRCSGDSPCEQCRARRKKCFFIERVKARGRVRMITKPGDDDSGSSSSGNNQYQDDGSSMSLTSAPSNSGKDRLAIVAERLLADDITAKFLMDVFIRRIHPHTVVVASTSPAFVFENVLKRTIKPSDAIQRDAGLAMACRMCGHEALGSQLVKRMEMNYEKAKEEPISQDAYSAMALLSLIMLSEDMAKGVEMIQRSFQMHRILYPSDDHIASTCEFLENLSLGDGEAGSSNGNSSTRPSLGVEMSNLIGCNEINGMCNDWANVTKAEITAHVQMATTQLMTWSQTLPDEQLRHLMFFFIELTVCGTIPAGRPSQVMYFTLLVDLHLLGCLIPPYVMEIILRRDPENKFVTSALFKPCAALEDVLEPCLLSEEIATSLLRRVLVCRMLQFESGIDMEVIYSCVVPLEILEITIQWRSGNREKAAKIGEWILGFIEHQDLNFWQPMISQNLLLLGTIFFEMGDGLNLMRTIAVLDKLRRSQPTVDIGIGILKDLQVRMVAAKMQEQQRKQ